MSFGRSPADESCPSQSDGLKCDYIDGRTHDNSKEIEGNCVCVRVRVATRVHACLNVTVSVATLVQALICVPNPTPQMPRTVSVRVMLKQ